MKSVLLCSAGGGSVFQAFDMASEQGLVGRNDFLLISDRECGAETAATDRGMAVRRIVQPDRRRFSKAVAECAIEFAADFVLMAFSRLVGPSLFRALPVFNLHPSLLPDFPGMGSVEAARKANFPVLGASLHLTDEGTDTGPILAQSWGPSPADNEAGAWAAASFVYKTYLALLVFEWMNANKTPTEAAGATIRATTSANPALTNPELITSFGRLAANRGLVSFVP